MVFFFPFNLFGIPHLGHFWLIYWITEAEMVGFLPPFFSCCYESDGKWRNDFEWMGGWMDWGWPDVRWEPVDWPEIVFGPVSGNAEVGRFSPVDCSAPVWTEFDLLYETFVGEASMTSPMTMTWSWVHLRCQRCLHCSKLLFMDDFVWILIWLHGHLQFEDSFIRIGHRF